MTQKNYTMQTAALKATKIDNSLINSDTLNVENCNASNIVSDSIQDSSGSAYLTKDVADELYGNSNLTANMAMVTDSNGKAIASPTISANELGYLDGVTSNVQTQLNAKQATVTGGATTITGSNLTANRALISNSSGKVAVSAVTSTELGYLDGVTSNVQTQLNDCPKVVTNYRNGSNWYREYSDGWIEQGGVWDGVGWSSSGTRNLMKTMASNTYFCVLQPFTDNYANYGSHYVVSKTTTNVTISGYGTGKLIWYACGK